MSNVQDTYNYLNKVLNIINNEIEHLNNEIHEKEIIIKSLSDQLKYITIRIVQNVQQQNHIQNEINKKAIEITSIQHKINSLTNEMYSNRDQSNHIKGELDAKNDMINKLDKYSPMASQLTEVTLKLQSNWNECINKINSLNKRISESEVPLNQATQVEIKLKNDIIKAQGDKQKLINTQIQLDSDLKSTGIQKTKAEDFRSSIIKFKNKVEGLIDNIKLGIEFKDDLLITKESIQSEITETYNKHNRHVPNDI